jgi:hypothetical protein
LKGKDSLHSVELIHVDCFVNNIFNKKGANVQGGQMYFFFLFSENSVTLSAIEKGSIFTKIGSFFEGEK